MKKAYAGYIVILMTFEDMSNFCISTIVQMEKKYIEQKYFDFISIMIMHNRTNNAFILQNNEILVFTFLLVTFLLILRNVFA